SNAGLLRRSQRGSTLNESCASITNNADWETVTLLESSMGSLHQGIFSSTLRLGLSVSLVIGPAFLPPCYFWWYSPLEEYRFTPERVALIPESPLVQRQL